VVGQTLKVSFKLFWGLHGSGYSHILKNVGISVKMNPPGLEERISPGMIKEKVIRWMPEK